MAKLNGKGRHTPVPTMRESKPTSPETPGSKRPVVPPLPPQGTKVQRTAVALRVIWSAVKLIWRVWL